MGGLFTGPVALVRALGLLASRPRIAALALIPAVLAFFISFGAVAAAAAWSDDLFALLVREPEGGLLHWLWQAGWIVTLLGSVLILLVAVPWLVMLLGFPLCEPLVARIDAELGGPPPAEGAMIAEILDSLRGTLTILAIGVTGSIVLFLLGLVPGLGLLTAPFVAFVWTPLFVAFDLLDSPLVRRGLSFRERLRVVTANPVAALSLGLVTAPLVGLPFVNLFGLPLAVAAGVIAMHGLERDGKVTIPTRRSAQQR
jgi:CysZ protein